MQVICLMAVRHFWSDLTHSVDNWQNAKGHIRGGFGPVQVSRADVQQV